jgi:VWFA-related protein
MTSRRAVAFISLVIAATLLDGAQDVPKFQTGAHLVQINVLVRDKNGPVSNLRKDDFVLTDKGKPQIIRVFSVTGPEDALAAQSALPENTFSNRTYHGNPASVTVVLLDRLNTLTSTGADVFEDNPKWLEAQALSYAKQQLVKFVKEMDSKDRVAIYSLAQSLSVLSDFTGEREQLLQILNGYSATSLTSREKVEPAAVHTPVPGDFDGSIDRQRQVLANLTNANRAQITLAALSSIATHLAAIPGRKNLVWLTADLPFPGAAVARVLGRANVAVYPMDARGLLPKAVFAPTNDAKGPGLFGGSAASAESRPRGQDTMERIAEDTGGRAFINTNNLADAIHAAVDDAAVSYTLGFYPEADSIDGKFHELKVRVKPGHFDLRYPKGYFALPDTATPQTQSSLLEAVESPLDAASIHVLARIERIDQPKPGSISISASIDLHQIELKPSGDLQKGAVEMWIVQQDAAGRIIARENKTLRLELTKANYEQILKTGVLFRELVEAKPGVATLRIVVADSTNATTGSLIIPMSEIK